VGLQTEFFFAKSRNNAKLELLNVRPDYSTITIHAATTTININSDTVTVDNNTTAAASSQYSHKQCQPACIEGKS
jgi:hypothetical protein